MDEFRLRDVERADLPMIWKWRNAEHIRIHMYHDQWIPWEDHVSWFERDQQNPSSYTKLFIYKERPLGVVRFTNIDQKQGTCEWGFYIGDPEAPKGAGTAMGMLGLDFMFVTVGIRKVCAEVLDVNVASLRFHEKLGFVPEGRLIEQIVREGKFIDVIPMGLFKNGWLKRREILKRGQDDGNRNHRKKGRS
ncbi:UDP-4-amino-4,6-dideoxy-N-acetyl-beta-L-altrosamine N-acetyltransferase [Halobacillus sp. HZG1]|uniref:UDP-4-amino-4, 6-dideoxy-N-acetyl-beta-L-altrosamine N-acetyltransferase n=1 Tax=Halobacillus sp. HZG1 TaxID=3111769 RepID=UPI002DBDA762|nr:UDP-4-amino-4,6-dideoxy-N-acetyl-beta-L-altrosamine N-acetyltransferase [Halobacillus sp. HZG1]MEC3885215.1 UDP-4-amino-4,6-dideoxy-N-acetyl-beta-L-altrosamine N-acetyltransferase [Halobacillus sp. HZG1]